MNITKMRAGGLAFVIAATGAFGLTACSSDSGAEASSGSDTEVSQEAAVDVATDLTNAKAAVDEALAEDPSWTQVMLASDVESPTMKYGLMVMPFVPSDAAARVTGTVNIDDGKYVIEAESAATGQTWQIDQDGKISEVTE